MNILVGGTGFIGTALSQKMVERREEVVSISLDGAGVMDGVNHITADLANEPFPTQVLDNSANVFILIGQHREGFDPEKEKKVLKDLAQNFLTGSQKLYYFSSTLVYGECRQPAKESDVSLPVGAYSRFKLESEAILQSLIPKERLVILRLANVYGSPKNRGIIGRLTNEITRNQNEIIILNGGGKVKRDYIFIDDVVDATLAIRDNPEAAGVVNIATGESYSLEEVVDTLSKVSGQEIAYQTSNTLLDGAKTVLVSNDQLKNHYFYQNFTSLEEGLEKTLSRCKNNVSY